MADRFEALLGLERIRVLIHLRHAVASDPDLRLRRLAEFVK
jgi:hypothetical protein